MWILDKVFARVPLLKHQHTHDLPAQRSCDIALGEVDITVSNDFAILSKRFEQYRQLQAELGRRSDRAITLPALAAIRAPCDASAKRKCGITLTSVYLLLVKLNWPAIQPGRCHCYEGTANSVPHKHAIRCGQSLCASVSITQTNSMRKFE